MSAFTAHREADRFFVTFDRCTREPLSWKEETYATARQIASRAKKPLWLCFSGGIDSQIMCQAFFDQGLNFSVLTLRHSAGTNDHDIAFAKTWCSEHDVHQKIVDIDFPQFLTDGIERYIKLGYHATHIFRYVQLKLLETVESLDGSAVMGSGTHHYKVDPQKRDLLRSDVFLNFNGDVDLPYAWMRDHQTDHEPYFFLLTPELSLAYLRIPLVEFALDHPDILRHPLSRYTFKRLVSQSVWPGSQSRPKYDGFENVSTQVTARRNSLRERFPEEDLHFELPVTTLIEQLGGAK